MAWLPFHEADGAGDLSLLPSGGVFLKGDQIYWVPSLYPYSTGGSVVYFSSTMGGLDPSSGSGGHNYGLYTNVLVPTGAGVVQATVGMYANGYWSYGGQSYSGADTQTATAVLPQVVKVDFIDHRNNNNLSLRKYPSGSTYLTEWEKPLGSPAPTVNEAAAYVRNTYAKVEITIDAPVDLTTTRTIQVRGVAVDSTDENFHAQAKDVQQWPVTLQLNSSPLYVYTNHYSDLEVRWEYKINGLTTWTAMNETQHRVYITHDQPWGSPVYDEALKKATGYAANKTTVADVCGAVRGGIATDIYYNPSSQAVIDNPLEAYTASGGVQCTEHARLMRQLMESINKDEGGLVYVWGGSSGSHYNGWRKWTGTIYIYPTVQFQAPGVDGAPADPSFNFHVVTKIDNNNYDATYDVNGIPQVIKLAAPNVNHYRLDDTLLGINNSPACTVLATTFWPPTDIRWHAGTVAVSIWP